MVIGVGACSGHDSLLFNVWVTHLPNQKKILGMVLKPVMPSRKARGRCVCGVTHKHPAVDSM